MKVDINTSYRQFFKICPQEANAWLATETLLCTTRWREITDIAVTNLSYLMFLCKRTADICRPVFLVKTVDQHIIFFYIGKCQTKRIREMHDSLSNGLYRR